MTTHIPNLDSYNCLEEKYFHGQAISPFMMEVLEPISRSSLQNGNNLSIICIIATYAYEIPVLST